MPKETDPNSCYMYKGEKKYVKIPDLGMADLQMTANSWPT